MSLASRTEQSSSTIARLLQVFQAAEVNLFFFAVSSEGVCFTKFNETGKGIRMVLALLNLLLKYQEVSKEKRKKRKLKEQKDEENFQTR